jgi:SNF2 family DNA or RNA helicase
MAPIAKDSILEGPYWPEPVRVLTAQVRNERIEIDAVGVQTERYFSRLLGLAEFEANVQVTAREAAPTFAANPHHFRLALEAQRIRLAYEYDSHFAISVSQIEPLPHQLAAVYDYILPRPRIRFMLADDPGAGKTIMAGLALKELKYRGVVDRTLVVVPANLIPQWQRELEEKFDEVFVKVDRGLLRAFPGRNGWELHSQCITSVDFAKQDDVMDTLRDVPWDLVIVDEAHKMAAYRYGKKLDKTVRYRLGELLSAETDGLLFLTATPHKGDPDNFLLLLQLLDPDLYADTDILQQAVRRDENPIFLRRMKEQMQGFDGKPLFPPRHPQTVSYRLSKPERRLYDAVTGYVEGGFQRAFREENRHVQLALLVLQRRVASSLRAIRRSLEKRKNRLEEIHARGLEALEVDEAGKLDWDELEDMPEVERWKVEDEAVARHTMARDLPELEKEIADLEHLIRLAQIAEQSGTERKLEELRGVMEAEGLFHSDEKLLIFTEARDTLDYLVENLESWGFRVTQIHGQMHLGDRDRPAPGTRLYAEQEFRDPQGAQIMVATEAAGEGINLQFCHLMINYDIPWNPNRLAQRMGRIHRYGQEKEVYIFNLVASDTREGDVVITLLEKLDVMRGELRSDAVFDVIDEIAAEQSLEQLFREALAKRRTFDEIKAAIDARFDPSNLDLVRKARLEGLASDRIDFSGVWAREQQAQEHRLMPGYVERFFVESFRALGEGEIEKRDDGTSTSDVPSALSTSLWCINWVRSALRDVPPWLSRRFGRPKKRYRRFTFHKDRARGDHPAEFVAPGHPLFEAVRHQVDERFASALREGAIFYDSSGNEGRLWFLHCSVQDGHSQTAGERVFAVFESLGGELEQWSLTSLLDLTEAGEHELDRLRSLQDLSDGRERVIDWGLTHCVDPYFEELVERRRREAEIKERYLKRSLNARISASMKKIGAYKKREQAGADMEIAIRQEEMRKEELLERRDRRLAAVELERHLSRQKPEVIGVAAVLPREPNGGMRSSEEIERIAMEVAMDYERRQGRQPEDVSEENLGFDVRSRGEEEIRRIEVKGRAGVGNVRLSANEWMQAKQLGESFWLYIVVNCAIDPQLYVLQNPAATLEPYEEVTVTSYLINRRSWQAVAERRDVEYRGKGG